MQPSALSYLRSCRWEEKERREDVHPGLSGNLHMGPPEWQPIVLNHATSTYSKTFENLGHTQDLKNTLLI